jgi:hypothetical protein
MVVFKPERCLTQIRNYVSRTDSFALPDRDISPTNAKVKTLIRSETLSHSPRSAKVCLTVDQIVVAVRRLPREQSVELFDLLLAETIDSVDFEIQ